MSDSLITNFHTHTRLCGHASGMPVDYILQAQKDGCEALGISDHCPYPVTAACYEKESRMDVSEVSLYHKEILRGASLVDFPVYFGFECEYQREMKNWYKDELLGCFGADYLVFGCHWGKNHLYIMDAKTRQDFHDYTDVTIEGIQSGLYKFLAHPDLIMQAYRNWDDDIKAMLSSILDAAIDADLPIEINGNGYNRPLMNTNVGKRYPYPFDEFWEMVAAKSNVKILCNSDAHEPEYVLSWAKDARNYAAKYGFSIIHNIFK